MKRRATAIVLIISIFAVTLSSCKRIYEDTTSDFSFIDEIIEIEEQIEYKPGKTQKSITDNSDNSDNSEKESKAMPTLPADVQSDVAQTVNTDEDITEPDVPLSLNSVEFGSNTAVSESDYYQYSTLSGDQKTLYKRITDTISSSKYIINTADLSLDEDSVLSVFQKVLADYPQYFYVSKSCMVAYGTKKNKIRAVALKYTDGDTTDEFDRRMRLVKTADRSIINQKIAVLKSKVEKAVSAINGNLNDVLKEKIIYDYVAETVSYDLYTAANINNFGSTLPHSFDIYGAIVESKAVCEGYSKLFQYLCYLVGINANLAAGTANGGNHMWNTAFIDGKWYQLDVTWDDGEEYIGYNYFNLTTDGIENDHTIDYNDISVPLCDGETNAFYNVFAVLVDDIKKDPENYENAVNNTALIGDRVIFVRFGDSIKSSAIRTAYLKRYILRENSAFAKYLKKLGITLTNSVNQVGRYYIIETEY